MGHWASNQIEKNTLLDYQARNNSDSLDDYPAMRSSMRARGERVWWALRKADVKRIYAQTEALLVGFVLGIALILVAQITWTQFGTTLLYH